MIGPLPKLLLAIVAALTAVDLIWLGIGHFRIDWPGYIAFALVTTAMAAGGVFYAKIRKDERLSAMLFGTAFLLAFSNLASVLNYFLLTVAGHRIDGFLAGIDRAMGVNWPDLIVWASQHRAINLVLMLVYGCVLPQIALLVPLLGWQSSVKRIYSFCLAMTVATVIAMGFWTIFPSFGAISVYTLPPALLTHTPLALDPHYAHELLQLLANGPGLISPKDLKGLIGFPSFHAVLALLVTWYARDLKYVRWPIIGINTLVIIATPIQGGHHVIDVIAGFAVTAISIVLAEKIMALVSRPRVPVFTAPLSGAPA
ncbi:MAG TPA: phosphatase PAP2 family protein [Rhizomicrobium sp.]